MKYTLNNNYFFFVLCTLCICIYDHSSQANEIKNFNYEPKKIVPSQYNDFSKISLLTETNKNCEVITIIDSIKNPLILVSNPITSLQSTYLTDSADYLKNIVGFTTIRSGGTNSDLIFRGMTGSRIRILADHGEIIGACSSRMDPASGYIDPGSFDILNIVKGPQTVLWGPVTSGCIIQFQRYHPGLEKSNIQLHSNITVGSNNSISKNIDTVLGIENGYIRLLGNIAHSDDYRDGNSCQIHSAWSKWNADAILSFNFPKNTHLEIGLGQGNGNANYATKPMDGLRFARDSYRFKVETVDINDFLNKIELQIWNYQINHLMSNVKNNFYSNIERKAPKIKKCCSFNSNLNNIDRNLWGIRSISTCQWNDVQFHSGIDCQINRHKKNTDYCNSLQIDTNSYDSGIFTEFICDSLLNQKFIGGTRIEYSTINIHTDSTYHIYNKIYPAGFIRYENNFYPSLFYYAGIGANYRLPDYWELLSANVNINKEYINKQIFLLKPEKTIQVDFGTYLQKQQLNGWVSSYIGYIKDFIYCNNKKKIQNDVNCISNVQAKIFGTEMGLNYKFNDYCTGEGNISYSWGMNIDDACIIPTIPPIEGTISCKWKQENYGMGVSWRVVASSFKQHKNKYLINPISRQNLLLAQNMDHTSGFGVFSMYFVWNMYQNYKCSIGINNIFNRNYKEYLNVFNNDSFEQLNYNSINEPGRIWWIKAEILL